MRTPFISVAGKDQSEAWGRRLKQSAAQRRGPTLLAETHPEASAISLRDAADEHEYLARYLELLRSRYAIRLSSPPYKGPPAFRKMARVFRKIFTLGHAQIAEEQSQINEVLILALRFQQEEMDERIKSLEAEIERLKGPSETAP